MKAGNTMINICVNIRLSYIIIVIEVIFSNKQISGSADINNNNLVYSLLKTILNYAVSVCWEKQRKPI